jgi:hypothetical protein
VDREHESPNSLAKSPRHGSRQHTDCCGQQPEGKIFKLVTEFGQLATVTSQEKYFKLKCNQQAVAYSMF